MYDKDSTQLHITNPKYNEQIKDLCKELEIDSIVKKDIYKGLGDDNKETKQFKKWELLASHNARDTFITRCIRKGIDIPTILSWTGQSKYEVMKKYISLDDKHKRDMMKKF